MSPYSVQTDRQPGQSTSCIGWRHSRPYGKQYVDYAPCGPACLSVLSWTDLGRLPAIRGQGQAQARGVFVFYHFVFGPPPPPKKKKMQNVRILSRAGQNPSRGGEWICRKIRTLEAESLADESFQKKKKNGVFIKKRVSLDTVCNFAPKRKKKQQNSSTSSSETRFL